jgi:hypothetical protein
MHTDGKETRHAWRRWWKLLADADPGALAQLASPALLASCNVPGGALDDARHDLWERWHSSADPVVAAALRLTLEESPLNEADPAEVARLATQPGEPAKHLLRMILGRVDERPQKRSDDDAGRGEASDARLAELNQVAERAGAPRIQPLPLEGPHRSQGTEDRRDPLRLGLLQQLDRDISPEFPAGPRGLSWVIRAWHNVSYDDRRSAVTLNRFADLIGYRLVELAGSDREADAAAVLRVLSGSGGYSDGALLLSHLAEGLERHGYSNLAAQAYTLGWTRARGGGGWLNFGGETALDSLRNATRLDPLITIEVVADETERVVAAGRYGTYGITQALVIAFAARALSIPNDDPVDMAFVMWEEALAVIADRAPRVDETDDPSLPYSAPEPNNGDRILGDLDLAFAEAALAGLFHAGLESKRRALLAAQALVTQRPGVAAQAVAMALSSLSDPATLTWLLCLISDQDAAGAKVIQYCAPVLRNLAQGPYLTIRAIARRLLPPDDAATLPLGPSDASLLMTPIRTLWTPGEPDDVSDTSFELVREVAGARLVEAQCHLAYFDHAALLTFSLVRMGLASLMAGGASWRVPCWPGFLTG